MLIVQFSADSLGSFDALVELEDELIDRAAPDDVVDGHDFGSGQANLFIITPDPEQAFARTVAPVLKAAGLLEAATAAFRAVDQDEHTVIWPPTHQGEFRVI